MIDDDEAEPLGGLGEPQDSIRIHVQCLGEPEEIRTLSPEARQVLEKPGELVDGHIGELSGLTGLTGRRAQLFGLGLRLPG